MLSRQEAEPRAHGRLEGVEPVAAEHPKVTFGSDAAGEVSVGCDNWMNTVAGELGCLLLGEVGAKCSDSDVASAVGQGDGDGIDRVFHDYRGRPSGELVWKN